MGTDFSISVSLTRTILENLNWATDYLKEFHINNPRHNAEELLSFISGKSRIEIYLEGGGNFDEDLKERFVSLIKKRAKGYPLQYILGNTEFHGLNFKVSPAVFIPRPETEILVETTINMAKLLNPVRSITSNGVNCQTVKLLDIGTGCGNIAIALAKFLPKAEISATDISEKAIETAKQNAVLNDVEIDFLVSDLFTNCELKTNHYELIVSNPPYIPTAEIENLSPEIRYEPRIALGGKEDGLFYIKKIIEDSPDYLKKGGILVIEIGFGQADAVKELFSRSEFGKIEFVRDYRRIERVIILYR